MSALINDDDDLSMKVAALPAKVNVDRFDKDLFPVTEIRAVQTKTKRKQS